MIRIALVLSLLSSSAVAQTSMNAEAFERYTQGKTLFFSQGGDTYGAEQYLDNRRVIWSFLDGECKTGFWYEQDGEICFLYEDRLDPQCWFFRQGSTGLIAEFAGVGETQELYEAQDTGEEMLCLGPEVGV